MVRATADVSDPSPLSRLYSAVAVSGVLREAIATFSRRTVSSIRSSLLACGSRRLRRRRRGSIAKSYPERFHDDFFVTDVGCQDNSWIAAVDAETMEVEKFADGFVWTVDLEFDRHGRLYALSHTGQISRILR